MLTFYQRSIASAALPVLRPRRKTRLIEALTPLRGYKKLTSAF